MMYYSDNMSIIVIQNGTTALRYACLKGNQDIVLILLQAGADKEIRDKVRKYIYTVYTLCINLTILYVYFCMVQQGKTILDGVYSSTIRKLVKDFGKYNIMI